MATEVVVVPEVANFSRAESPAKESPVTSFVKSCTVGLVAMLRPISVPTMTGEACTWPASLLVASAQKLAPTSCTAGP